MTSEFGDRIEGALYHLALHLHQDMKLGTFSQCVEAARINKLSEAQSIAYLKDRNKPPPVTVTKSTL
jgi:hypothetical protein